MCFWALFSWLQPVLPILIRSDFPCLMGSFKLPLPEVKFWRTSIWKMHIWEYFLLFINCPLFGYPLVDFLIRFMCCVPASNRQSKWLACKLNVNESDYIIKFFAIFHLGHEIPCRTRKGWEEAMLASSWCSCCHRRASGTAPLLEISCKRLKCPTGKDFSPLACCPRFHFS